MRVVFWAAFEGDIIYKCGRLFDVTGAIYQRIVITFLTEVV
jgi:hypothetical protein